METNRAFPRVPGLVLDELIGQGAFADVYRAHRTNSTEQVAVKVLIRDNSADVVNSFLEEGKRLRQFQHRHLIDGLGATLTAEGRPVIVMELAVGTVHQWLSDERQVVSRNWRDHGRIEAVNDVVGSVGAALDFLHQNQLVHKDVKPSNIFFVRQAGTGVRTVKLGDLGIAHELSEQLAREGALGYTAPEVELGVVVPEHQRHLADVFSLAIVATEMLTGVAPRLRGTADDSWMNSLSDTVSAALRRGLHPDLNKRSSSGTEFAADLQRALARRPRSVYVGLLSVCRITLRTAITTAQRELRKLNHELNP
jgi:serine/threonine protein kinase